MSFTGLLIDTMDVLRRTGDLVTNGGFADASSWSVAAGVAIADGDATFTGADGTGPLSQSITATVDTRYRIEMDVTLDLGTPSLAVTFGGKSFAAATATGEYEAEARADDATGLIFTGDGVGGNNITIDNVQLFEIDAAGNVVKAHTVHLSDVPCRYDEKRGREIVDGQFTSISKPNIFTEERDIQLDDLLRMKTRAREAVTNFDLHVDEAPREYSNRSAFHHVEVGCIRVDN